MKKSFAALALIPVLLLAASCSPNAGKVKDAVIELGESERFVETEIKDAANCVLNKFKDFEGCELKKLLYDEERSDAAVAAYIAYGKGAKNGAREGDVIVFYADFHVGPDAEKSFDPNSDYNDWNFILIRDGKTGSWKADDWGY